VVLQRVRINVQKLIEILEANLDVRERWVAGSFVSPVGKAVMEKWTEGGYRLRAEKVSSTSLSSPLVSRSQCSLHTLLSGRGSSEGNRGGLHVARRDGGMCC
jgi:hypothetical protein